MEDPVREALDRRLARIEGQVRGLRRMVADRAYCADVLTQLSATRNALGQVGAELAASHVRTCVVGADRHERAKGRSREELHEELRLTLSRLVR
jgi:DNA-binding FrmR family transcriptional regulator